MTRRILLCIISLGLTASASQATQRDSHLLVPRAQVIRGAEILAEAVERLDEALHDLQVPAQITHQVHHAEETVMEFRDLLEEKVPVPMLIPEFRHLGTDMRALRRTLEYGYPGTVRVLAWDMWKAYRYLARDFRNMDPFIAPNPAPIPDPNPNPNPGPDPNPNPGPDPAPGGPSLGGKNYTVVDGTLQSEKGAVTGTGTLMFTEDLPNDDNNFALEFELNESDGYVTLISNSDEELEKGVELSFYRNEDGSLGVELKVDSESYDVTEDFDGAQATGSLSVSVDVHEHGHLVIELNGGEEVELAFTTKVAGKHFGLSLDKSVVKGFSVSPAKHEH